MTLVNAQIQLVKTQPIDSLLDAIFLSDIDLAGRSQPPGVRELNNLLEILKTENAKITIRNKYLDYEDTNSNTVTQKLAELLYLSIVNDKANQGKLQTKLTLLFNGKNEISYDEIEAFLLNELVAFDSLKQLSDVQIQLSQKTIRVKVEEPVPDVDDSQIDELSSPKRMSSVNNSVVIDRSIGSPITNDKVSVTASVISRSTLKSSDTKKTASSKKSSRFEDDDTYADDDALKKTYSNKVEFHGDVDHLIDSIHETGILDIKSSNLSTINIPQIISSQFLHKIKVLVLRDNNLKQFADLGLPFLKCLTDLDLAHNKFNGAIPDKSIPSAVLRLDLSYNSITDISNLQGTCYHLKVFNISNNALKRLPPLPTKLEWLDLSDNKLSDLRDLRVLSLSPKITALGIAGNPLIDNDKSDWKIRVISYLPDIAQIDGTLRAGYKLKERVMQYNELEKAKRMLLIASPKVSRSEQEKSDHARFKIHHLKSQQLEKSRQKMYKEMSDMKIFPKQSMTPVKINELTDRLYSPYSGRIDASNASMYIESPQNNTEGNENYLRRQDPTTIVNTWLLKSQQEVARATYLVGFSFRICDYQLFSKAILINFIKSIDSVTFLQGVMLSPDVDNAMIDLPTDPQSKALGELAADTLETMVALSYVLRNVRQILLENESSGDIAAILREYLDDYLVSPQCQVIATNHDRSLQSRYEFANKEMSKGRYSNTNNNVGNGDNKADSVFERLTHQQIHNLNEREKERDFDHQESHHPVIHHNNDAVYEKLSHTPIHNLTEREKERDFEHQPTQHHISKHDSDVVVDRLAHTPIHHIGYDSVSNETSANNQVSSDVGEVDTGKYDSAIDRLKKRINQNKGSSPKKETL